MKVLVIGASGKTGRPVVDALAAGGVEVRAAGRTPVPDGVLFDWADPGTWPEALRDVDALYVVGPYMYPDRPGLVGDLLAAAPHARRVVLLSVLGVELLPGTIPMARWEADVRASGKEWTILRPNWFQQNFGEGFAAPLRDLGVLTLPAADAAVGFVDTRDIAEVAAAALTEDGHAGQTHVLTGPEALTYAQVVRILGEAAGRELRYTALDLDEHIEGLRAAGLDERSVAWQRGLFQLIRDGRNAVMTDTVERVTGHPARSLEAYAHEHAATWRTPVPAGH
ncbi:NmrA family NAD(P)-binding protein [Nonomuraea sp. 3N208]|uniref:NmrA family NAD(P)-binding protein n=1 Tax=Nonomuraea sp. 3N208 TaxID=3457421 RepID=UPI003FD5CA3F